MRALTQKLSKLLASLVIMASFGMYAVPGQVAFAQGVDPDATFTPTGAEDDCTDPDVNSGNCKIIEYLIIFINGLSAIVGVTIVAVIVVAGIKYASSADDPNAVADAKNRIKNAMFALLAYIFMFAFLQWVVPGGIF